MIKKAPATGDLEQQKTKATKQFLHRMRAIQASCCPVCPQCRKDIIDEGITLANAHAELARK